jgi:hypothetical protein
MAGSPTIRFEFLSKSSSSLLVIQELALSLEPPLQGQAEECNLNNTWHGKVDNIL